MRGRRATPRRRELTEDETRRIAEARRTPLGPVGFVKLVARKPGLAREAATIVTHAVTQGLAESSALGSLVSAERARQVVPGAATGVGWHPDDELIAAMEPMLLPSSAVLELGGGAGRTARMIAGRVGSLTTTDMSRAMVEEATRELRDFANVRVLQTDGFTLGGFGDQTFDLVFAAGMFGYVEAGPALGLLDEIHRVLRPGGALVINLTLLDDGEDRVAYFVEHARAAARKKHGSGTVERPYALTQMTAWFDAVGLSLVAPQTAVDRSVGTWRSTLVARRPAADH